MSESKLEDVKDLAKEFLSKGVTIESLEHLLSMPNLERGLVLVMMEPDEDSERRVT